MTGVINDKALNEKIILRNLYFDDKLKEKDLLDFIRTSNYIHQDTEINLLHTACGREFSVTPHYFFRKKHKCPHCYNDRLENKNKNNIAFDKKLKQKGLVDFIRKSDYIDINTDIKLLHLTCGDEFLVKPMTFFYSKNKHKCPYCFNKEIINKKNIDFDNELKERGLSDFVRKSDYINRDTKIKLVHTICGNEFFIKPRHFFIKMDKCSCGQSDKCSHNNKSIYKKNIKFDNKLKQQGLVDFQRISDYIDINTDIKLLHLTCGNEFVVKPIHFFKNKYKCHYCHNNKLISKKNIKFDNKLKQKGLVDFIRKSDYIDMDTEIKLFHIKCNREFWIKPKYFFKNKHKCSYCYKKDSNIRKRTVPKNEFYQEKINKLTNNQFLLLSDYYNLSTYIKLKHLTCGHTFETRADSFEKAKEKCPNCSDIKKDYNKTILQKVKELEGLIGPQYEILDRGFNYNDTILIKHKSCGNIFKLNVASITKFKNKKRTSILCPKCNLEDKKESFLDSLDRIQGTGIKLKGAFKGISIPTKFYHKKCNKTFVTTPSYLLKNKMENCPECRNDSQQENFLKKLNSLHGDKFELVGSYNGYDNKVRLKHKSCGSVFDIFPSNLFEKRNPCSECSKKEIILEKNEQYKKKIKNLYNGKFNLIGEVLGVKYEAEFLCNSCGNTFKEKLETLLRGKKKCPHCKN